MLTQKQEGILNAIADGKWNLNSEGLVDVDGIVKWYKYTGCENIINFQGIRFGKVTGSFICLDCYKLESLEGSPFYVGGYYDLDNCVSLKTLEGISQDITLNLWIHNCYSLYSIKGIGKIGGEINSHRTPLIEGFDDLSPEEQEAIRNSNAVSLLC